MPDAFDLLGDAVTTDKGTIYDYDASAGEAAGAGFDRQWDTNPLALGARMLRTFDEDFKARFVTGDLVDQKAAEEEVRSRGLDLKIPVGGITRYELDMLQYLKQREIRQNTVGARAKGVTGAAAGFAGGVAASFADPINVASGFIPFVSQYRYAQWLARAGTSTAARAGVRAGAGAIEGAAGAAVLEPLVYAGATSQQLDYGLTDSFLNVTLGSVMGGGLHTIGGAVYDARVSRALRGLDEGIQGNDALRAQVELRDAAAAMPEHAQREVLQSAVAAMERGEPVDIAPQVARHAEQERARASDSLPKTLDEFSSSNVEQAWLNEAGGLRVYARRGIRELDGEKAATLDIPTVTAAEKGAGAFTDFVRRAEAAPFDAIYVENVLNEQLVAFLERNGFKKDRDAVGGPPSYYKWTGKSVDPDAINRQVAEFNARHQGPDRALHEATRDAEWAPIRAQMSRRRQPFMGSSRPEIGTGTTKPQSPPRDLSSLMQDAKALRTEAAFNRQFGEQAVETIKADASKPKDKIERVKQDDDEFREVVEEYRAQGRLTEGDDAKLKEADELASWAERRAKAFEAAAGCMEAS